MEQYIEVKEANDSKYCNACGKRFDDPSMEEKLIYDIGFVQKYESGNTISQRFNLCWNCTKELSRRMTEARYDSMCKLNNKKED